MIWLELPFQPTSGFGTPPRGTTLFGQCCALLGRAAPARLTDLLRGYTEGQPFAVVGDPRPRGHVPRPSVPLYHFKAVSGIGSKEVKARRWTDEQALQRPLEQWLAASRSDADIAALHGGAGSWRTQRVHALARGQATDAPVERWEQETWFSPTVPLLLDVLVDPGRCEAGEMLELLRAVGWEGYGAAASRGLGKFELGAAQERPWRAPVADEALLTLGHCAPLAVARPQLLHSFYRATIHHGRHGAGGLRGGHPLDFAKAPVALAQPGALLCPAPGHALPFYGRGLGGPRAPLSLRDRRTILQGYAPVLPVRFDAYAKHLRQQGARGQRLEPAE